MPVVSKLVDQIALMLIVLSIFLWMFYWSAPASAIRPKTLACDLVVPKSQLETSPNGDFSAIKDADNRRIIAIGDVHGAYKGLLEVLHGSKITKSPDGCEWAEQGDEGVILVQQGDLVDRGPQSLEALHCLRHLQKEADKYNSKVIRLIGNHEMWWLNGYFHDRNAATDTRERIIDTIVTIADDIADGSLLAAYAHTSNDVPILFVHAGVRPQYYDHLRKALKKGTSELSANEVADASNAILRDFIAKCEGKLPCRESVDEFFEAGPDRGGAGIGGPLWTDFNVLVKADQQDKAPPGFIQVVGHTAAFCYVKSMPGVHQPLNFAECAKGLVRASPRMQAVCVDGGMYLGARAYLEIGSDGHFRAYQQYRGDPTSPLYSTYQVTDLTAQVCDKGAQ